MKKNTKLTTKIKDRIVQGIHTMKDFGEAAVSAGISEDTLFDWIDQGMKARREKREGNYRVLADAVERELTLGVARYFDALYSYGVRKYVPIVDYSQIMDQELIIWIVWFKAWGRESIWKIMGVPDDLDWKIAIRDRLYYYNLAESIMGKPTPKNLAALFLAFTPDLRPLCFVLLLWIQLYYLYKEFEKRLEPHRIAKDIVLPELRHCGTLWDIVLAELRHSATLWDISRHSGGSVAGEWIRNNAHV